MGGLTHPTDEIHKNLIARHLLQQAQAMPQHPCLEFEPDLFAT